MSPRQLERRRSLIQAATDLVSEIGVEKIQMKQVSERSGVALGTAYRYFSSKDHQLAAAIADWESRLMADMLTDLHSSRAPTAVSDRVVLFVHRGMRAFQRRPHMAHLLVSATVSTDPFASEVVSTMARIGSETMLNLMPEVPHGVRDVAQHIVSVSRQGELIAWVTGRTTFGDASHRLEKLIRVILGPYDV